MIEYAQVLVAFLLLEGNFSTVGAKRRAVKSRHTKVGKKSKISFDIDPNPGPAPVVLGFLVLVPVKGAHSYMSSDCSPDWCAERAINWSTRRAVRRASS